MTTRELASVLLAILGIWWLVQGAIQIAIAVAMVFFSTMQASGDFGWFDIHGSLLISTFGSLAIGAVVLRFRENIARRLVPATQSGSDAESSPGQLTAPRHLPIDAGGALSIGVFCVGVWLMATSLGPVLEAAKNFDADRSGDSVWLLIQSLPFLAGTVLAVVNRGVLEFLDSARRAVPSRTD